MKYAKLKSVATNLCAKFVLYMKLAIASFNLGVLNLLHIRYSPLQKAFQWEPK